jgi:hypothetical protein
MVKYAVDWILDEVLCNISWCFGMDWVWREGWVKWREAEQRVNYVISCNILW